MLATLSWGQFLNVGNKFLIVKEVGDVGYRNVYCHQHLEHVTNIFCLQRVTSMLVTDVGDQMSW